MSFHNRTEMRGSSSKRTFPWDYTTYGKPPELKSYIPRSCNEEDDIQYKPRGDDRRPEVTLSMDNPAFYEPSSHDYVRQNPSTRNREDPNSYNRSVHFQPPTNINNLTDGPAIISNRENIESGLRERYLPTLPDQKEIGTEKSSKRCCSYRVLVIIVIVLLLLLLTMTGLFAWRMVFCNDKENVPFPTTAPNSNSLPTGCTVNPSAVPFKTLPQRVRLELDNFNSFIEKEVNKNQSVAVSANIVYGDNVIWEGGFGVLNKSEQPPRSPNGRTVYPCASTSKILTAVILFKLINDKRVQSLDDKVARYEARFSVKNPFDNQEITLRELATQRSGFQREAPCYPQQEGSNNICPYSYDTMLNRIKNLTLIRKPGTKPQYSNLAYGLLGRVLFNSFSVSGLDFNQWMKNEIFLKLDMRNSSFSVSNSQKADIPVGYMDKQSIYPIQDWGWLEPAGGMFSSVKDLSKLAIELMTDKTTNRFLSQSLTNEIFWPDYIFPGGKMMTGIPWEIRTHDGYLIREKSGYIYGYNSYVAMVPEIRLAINLLCTDCQQKLSSSVPAYFRKMLSVFKEELARVSFKNFTLPSDSKPFIGHYNSSIPVIQTMDVKANSGHLSLIVNGLDVFFLNYTEHLTFKISINPAFDCITAYTLGVANDVVVFDKPSTVDGRSQGFVMYGASPDGRSYFKRIS